MRTWHGVTDCRGRFEEQPEAVNRTNMQPLFWSQCNACATLGVPYHEEVMVYTPRPILIITAPIL